MTTDRSRSRRPRRRPIDRHRNRRGALTALAAAFALALAGSACVPDGQCEGTGGVVDECKAGWTLEECAEWDEEQVNGSRWRFTYESCEALGYTAECSDGSYLKPEDAGNCG